MKLFAILFAWLSCVIYQSAWGRDPDWFQRRMAQLDQTLQIQDTNQKIAELGKFIRIGELGMDTEQQQIFDKTQKYLLSIPGHAKYYQDQIEETRERVREHAKLPQEVQNQLQLEDKWKGLGHYKEVRGNAFRVLRLLPSPETVAVLGHFIEDPEERDGKNMLGNPIRDTGDALREAPNCGKAYIALANLGIEHPPAKGTSPYPDDLDYDLDRVDKWKDWWGEVKAGQRTYRFIGSDIEYGPDGPATKEQLAKIAKDRKRAEEQRKGRKGVNEETGSSLDGRGSSKATLIASILAGFVLLGSLFWYFRKAAR